MNILILIIILIAIALVICNIIIYILYKKNNKIISEKDNLSNILHFYDNKLTQLASINIETNSEYIRKAIQINKDYDNVWISFTHIIEYDYDNNYWITEIIKDINIQFITIDIDRIIIKEQIYYLKNIQNFKITNFNNLITEN